MVNEISLAVPDQELAESLTNCKVGETKKVEFRVTSVGDGSLSGDVTSVAGYEKEYEEDAGPPPKDDGGTEESGGAMGAMKKRMPKVIVMMGSK